MQKRVRIKGLLSVIVTTVSLIFILSNNIIVNATTNSYTNNYKLLFFNINDNLAVFIIIASTAFSMLMFFYHKRLRKIVNIDQLTGLYTKYKFILLVREKLKNAEPNEYTLTSFDVDNLKYINRTYGWEKGNELLCAIAKGMKVYISNDAIMGRYENDVFIVFSKTLPSHKYTENDKMFGTTRLESITKTVGLKTPVHISAGVYHIGDPKASTDYIIDCLNKARMLSKNQHGNIVTVYSDELKKQSEIENTIYSTMEKAITNKEFFIVIQPKIELLTGRLIGGEVLVRWKKEDGTFVYPDDFIPLFEKNNFIIELDEYVFRQTCEFIKSSHIELPRISVNISSITALSKNFLKRYLKIIDEYALSPSNFELELTESALVNADNYKDMFKFTHECKKAGFVLSIDDFGKGASSLSRIKRLNIDIIKLDREFISINSENEKGKIVISSILSMANKLGITTLAEGIETKENLDLLVNLGCDHGQGYLFDKPLPTTEFLSKIVKDSLIQYPNTIKSSEKIKDYLSDFNNLPYSIMLLKNDPYFTIISASNAFYKLIGYTKQEFFEKHENRISNILMHNLSEFITNKTTSGDSNFSFDTQFRSATNKIILTNNTVHYNKRENLFYVTVVDITSQSINSKVALSFSAQLAEKACLMYLSDHTTDLILISNNETEEVVYVNPHAMKYLNYTKESDWKGKKYVEVAFGSEDNIDKSYYEPIYNDVFTDREYYNKHHNKFFHVENKLIDVMDRTLRLNIVTDITAEKNLENELSIQKILNNCVLQLYNSDSNKSFKSMLKSIEEYFDADRAYYYSFNEDLSINEKYVTLNAGHASIGEERYMSLPIELKTAHLQKLTKEDVIYRVFTPDEYKEDEYQKFGSYIHGAVKKPSGETTGFIGIDNPKININNKSVMSLLSPFVYAFDNNRKTKQIEAESLTIEETSKINILKKCTFNLQTYDDMDNKIMNILELLREHFEAKSAMILKINEDRKTFSVIYENHHDIEFNGLDKNQNRPISLIKKWIEDFEKNNSIVAYENCNPSFIKNDGNVDSKKQKNKAYSSPMYDKNGLLTNIIVVNNPTIMTRSQTLIHVVGKLIFDYLEKSNMQHQHQHEISLDPLTGIYNKISTRNIISSFLDSGIGGVMFFIDIDEFKQLNDTLGHGVGDIAITNLAKEIKQIFKPTDIVGRVGGDEFMVFCPNPISDRIVHQKANNLLKLLSRQYEKDGKSACITVSIGACRTSSNGENFDQLYDKTDKAVYCSKNSGKNRYYYLEK